MGVDVLGTTTDLTADDHTTMPVFHFTVADDDILRGHVTLTAIAVSSALDGDTVITGIEKTVLNQHTVATLRVTAVAIGAVVDHLYPTNGDIRRVQGMDHPERRTQQGDILQQDTFTLVEVD